MKYSDHRKPNYNIENSGTDNQQPNPSWASGIAILIIITIFSVMMTHRIEIWLIGLWIIYLGLWIRSLSPASQDDLDSPRTESKPRKEWIAPVEIETPSPVVTVSRLDIANQALHRAGNKPNSSGLLLLDIGLLSYDGGSQPKINRVETIPAYTTHLRPFVVLYVTEEPDLRFALKLELMDENEQVRFLAEEHDHFQRGKNFITPQNWLPMTDESEGNWSLCVSIDDHLLARHEFAVAPDVGVGFRSYIRADGEIDEWLSKSAASVPTESLSLDELIGDQADVNVNTSRES